LVGFQRSGIAELSASLKADQTNPSPRRRGLPFWSHGTPRSDGHMRTSGSDGPLVRVILYGWESDRILRVYFQCRTAVSDSSGKIGRPPVRVPHGRHPVDLTYDPGTLIIDHPFPGRLRKPPHPSPVAEQIRNKVSPVSDLNVEPVHVKDARGNGRWYGKGFCCPLPADAPTEKDRRRVSRATLWFSGPEG
jgi:hypothetical protein